MRTLGWCAAALIAMTLVSAVAARLPAGVPIPDVAAVMAVFCAFRRGPVAAAATAAVVGHLAGWAALAPTGALEASGALVASGVFALSGQLAGGGRTFFSLAAAGAAIAWELVAWALIAALQAPPPPPPWAGLAGRAMATAGLAALGYRGLLALDRRLMRDDRRGLGWR